MLKKDFELIEKVDKTNFLNNIEMSYSNSLEDIKDAVRKEAERIFETSYNEKKIYTAFSLLINLGIKDISFSKISESTLKVLLKYENRKIGENDFYTKNKNFHIMKFQLFNTWLDVATEGIIVRDNKFLDLNGVVIHIDNLIKLQKIYKFKNVEGVIISDNINKIISSNNNPIDFDFIINSGSTIYSFGNKINELDLLDFSYTKTESNTKFRFFIGEIEYLYGKDFKGCQNTSYNIYNEILNNHNVNSENIIFPLKLKHYIPQMTKNIENRDIVPNELE